MDCGTYVHISRIQHWINAGVRLIEHGPLVNCGDVQNAIKKGDPAANGSVIKPSSMQVAAQT